MGDVLADLQTLQREATEAERRRARREAERDAATERKNRIMAVLKEKYGVETVEAAKELLASKEKDLKAGLARFRKSLKEAQA